MTSPEFISGLFIFGNRRDVRVMFIHGGVAGNAAIAGRVSGRDLSSFTFPAQET